MEEKYHGKLNDSRRNLFTFKQIVWSDEHKIIK